MVANNIISNLFKPIMMCLFLFSTMNSFSKEDSTTTLKRQFQKDLAGFEKKKASLKKKVKDIEKKVSFKKLIHHADSVKKINQFVHEQKTSIKGDSNLYNIESENLGLPFTTFQATEKFSPKYEVFGWYPNWENNYYEKINYSLISTIAYFSYEVNPKTGNAITIYDWKTTPLIDSTKKNNVKSLLTVSCFGAAKNKEFLLNKEAVKTLVKNAIELIVERGSNGICLDFEGVAEAQKSEYTAFITLLSQELRKENKNYLLYLSVPSVNWAKSLQFDLLIPVVDRFVIMGYGYYGPSSKIAGPVANLSSGKEWEPYNLSLSVDYYLSNKIPSSQLILALPFFGSIWQTKGGSKFSEAENYLGAKSYSYIKANINAKTQYDSISQSAWCAFVDSSNTDKFNQCWFDNDSTLSVKLNYIKSRKLAGMGIWALGYDKGYPELWDAIAKNMCDTLVKEGFGILPTLAVTAPDSSKTFIQTQLDNLESLLKGITNYQTILLYNLCFIVFFGGTGFVISMFKPETRIFFFGNTAYTIYYTSFILLFLIVILRWTDLVNNSGLALLIGFLVGGIAVGRVKHVLDRINRNKP